VSERLITTLAYLLRIFLSEGLERYKDTQVKTYDITKLTAELKGDNV